MDELKACPFCGSPGELTDNGKNGGSWVAIVQCSSPICCAKQAGSLGNRAASRSSALRSWNTRAEKDVQSAVDTRNAADDMRDFGTGFEVDGKRVDPSRVTVYALQAERASVPDGVRSASRKIRGSVIRRLEGFHKAFPMHWCGYLDDALGAAEVIAEDLETLAAAPQPGVTT